MSEEEQQREDAMSRGSRFLREAMEEGAPEHLVKLIDKTKSPTADYATANDRLTGDQDQVPKTG